MAKQSEREPREQTPLTATEVRELAKKLAYFAKRYEEVAESMVQTEIASIGVIGLKTVMTGIGYIQQGVLRANQALDRVVISGQSSESIAPVDASERISPEDPGMKMALRDMEKNKERRNAKREK